MRIIKSITFFGSSIGDPGDPNFDAAKNTAKAIAKLGIRVVDGGGPGIMRAATQGAKDVNGKTTAVYYEPEFATNFEGQFGTNIADVEYKEENYIERTKRLLELGDAYIIYNGGTGTISEFGMAWGLARLYFGHHKPLMLYGNFWNDIIAKFKEHMKLRMQDLQVLTIVDSPDKVVDAITKYDLTLSKNRHDHRKCNDSECRLLL